MIPWTFLKLNLLFIFTFNNISQVSIFNFHTTWLVFQIFWIKSDISQGLEKPKRQISAHNVMAIGIQRHANVSKQATLLDGFNVSPIKWRVCGCGLNRFVHEGMNHISNVEVHSKTRSGNVNIKLYHNLLPEWEQYTFLTAKNDWVSRVVPSAYFSISDYQLS